MERVVFVSSGRFVAVVIFILWDTFRFQNSSQFLDANGSYEDVKYDSGWNVDISDIKLHLITAAEAANSRFFLSRNN